jgi:hypothetical protein
LSGNHIPTPPGNKKSSGSIPWEQICPEVVDKRFKKCCIADEMDRREEEEQVENVGSEQECVRQKI